jgi:hypothetical protein
MGEWRSVKGDDSIAASLFTGKVLRQSVKLSGTAIRP